MIGPLLIEAALNSFEKFSIQDGWLLAGKDLAFEGNFSDVKPVSKEMGERTTG